MNEQIFLNQDDAYWARASLIQDEIFLNIPLVNASNSESPKNMIWGAQNWFLGLFGLSEAPVYICIYIKEKK